MKAQRISQHEPLRIPQGWQGQNAQLVMQIERLFDDVYRQLQLIKKKLKELEDSGSEEEE